LSFANRIKRILDNTEIQYTVYKHDKTLNVCIQRTLTKQLSQGIFTVTIIIIILYYLIAVSCQFKIHDLIM